MHFSDKLQSALLCVVIPTEDRQCRMLYSLSFRVKVILAILFGGFFKKTKSSLNKCIRTGSMSELY